MAAMTSLLRPCALPRATQPFQTTSSSAHSFKASQSPAHIVCHANSSTSQVPASVSARVASGSTASTSSRPASGQPSSSGIQRRDLLLMFSPLVLTHLQGLIAPGAVQAAERGLARYIRKKQLDPLDSYVPLVLEARAQLQLSRTKATNDLQAGRQLLRQGALNGLRDNIRALGEYAVQNGKAKEAAPLVAGFFRALEEYDQLLVFAIRDSKVPEPEELDSKANATVAALDALLETVPEDVLERARNVLAVATAKAAEAAALSDGTEQGGSVERDELLEKLLK